MEKWAILTGKDIEDAAEAAYHLCLCHCNNFGAQFSPDKALSWILKSANSGLVKAQAEVKRLFAAFGREIPENLTHNITDWLTKATVAGSQVAAIDLETWNPDVYLSARIAFRHRFASVDNGIFDIWDISRLTERIEADVSHIDSLIVNERGHRLLHCAASCGAVDAVRILLDRGGDVNVLNNERETPLLCAFRAGYLTIIKLLIRNGADFGIPSETGETALHWLIGLSKEDIPEISLLLENHPSSLPLEAEYISYEESDYALDRHPRGTPLDWPLVERDTTD